MSQQYQDQKEKWFDNGYNQAKKEMIEKIDKKETELIGERKNYDPQCDYWAIITNKVLGLRELKKELESEGK